MCDLECVQQVEAVVDGGQQQPGQDVADGFFKSLADGLEQRMKRSIFISHQSSSSSFCI